MATQKGLISTQAMGKLSTDDQIQGPTTGWGVQ